MSTYEIEDDVVRRLVGNADLLPPNLQSAVMALEEQIPIPVPTKIGAVVRTESGDVFTLTSAHRLTDLVWIAPNGFHAVPEAIGRITEVLSEGVDIP